MSYHIKWVINRWKNHKKMVFILLFLTILSVSVSVAYPLVFKYLLDTLKNIIVHPDNFPTPMKEVNRILWIIFAIGIASLISYLYPGMRGYMNLLFEYILRKEYFSFITEKDYKFFSKFRTGDLVTRLTDDISDFPKISWFLCSGIFRAFNSSIKIVFCLLAMFYLNWKLTLLSIIPLPIMVLVFYITSEKLYSTFKKNQESISEINNQLELSFSGVRIIKSFVCENKYNRFFSIALNKRFHTEMKVVKLNTIMNLIYEYVDQFAQIGVILFGGYMAVKGEITIGTFYAFYSYLSMLIYPILDIPQLFVSGKQAFVNIDRLEEIKNFPTINKKNRGKIKIDKIENIQFKNITFYYETRRESVLSNINFNSSRGEKTLILGPIGSGKTTILGLLTGILPVEKGEILINNIPLKSIDIIKFRDKIGYVPQEPLLFSGSIKDNIMFGNKELSDKQIDDIIDIVQMRDEINKFKDGNMTLVGQKGMSLSGGQKQRIAIARALAKKPEILILDDITASLDAENEEKLWGDIDMVFKNITCFIVSHRLSTIKYVNNIIFLDSGSLVGHGKHEELMIKYPEYKNFIYEHLRKRE